MAAPSSERLVRVHTVLAGPRKFVVSECGWADDHEAYGYMALLERIVDAIDDLVDGYDRDEDKEDA